MPISSGAGGRPSARLHLPAGGGTKQTHWPNNVASLRARTNGNNVNKLSSSESVLDVRNQSRREKLANFVEVQTSEKSSAPIKRTDRMKIKRTRGQGTSLSPSMLNSTATGVEKYKQINHISEPSSNSTTSPIALKYFDNNQNGTSGSFAHQVASGRNKSNSSTNQTNAPNDSERASETNENNLNSNKSTLLSSLMAFGANHKENRKNQTNSAKPRNSTTQSMATMKKSSSGENCRANVAAAAAAAAAHFPIASSTTINQNNGQFNPSLSPAFSIDGAKSLGKTLASSTSSSTANLHSLSSLHQQPTTMINKRINLKYVKTLIVLLMSLDFVITLFVHHFAGHDEFSLVFTTTKLRLSLVNLVLSAIWFIVLAGAILFDVYFILVIGCLVDAASFALLLACSVYHFTHRIDYNLVSLTSLLLLLFSIIVLHVYLLVIAALTIYLTLAVKRRRKH